MAYNAERDVEIAKATGEGVELSLRQYDGGAPKVQISQFRAGKDGGKFYLSSGRLDVDRAREVARLIPKLLTKVPKTSAKKGG